SCSSLTSITIPEGVTSIGREAFAGCSGLTSLTIPEGVTKIGRGALSNIKCIICLSENAALLKADVLNPTVPDELHVLSPHMVSVKYRPAAAAGFAKEHADRTTERGKAHMEYIKSNAGRIIDTALANPDLLYLMIEEKLIAAKDMDGCNAAAQKLGNVEQIAALLEYGNSSLSEKDKAKVQQKKETREETVMNFAFDAENLAALAGKTFVVTGKLSTFSSRDELKECIETCGAKLMETLSVGVDYLITNTPDSGSTKNKLAKQLSTKCITEEEFNAMIGRQV
ncbi:MAG: leucine-rich repeat protein, partial [Raoultibacter sp.]